jgi:hypothetical protein
MSYSVDVEKDGEPRLFNRYKSGLFLYDNQLHLKIQTSGGNGYIITKIDGTPLFDSTWRNEGQWTYRLIQPCKLITPAEYKRFWVSWYCDSVDFGQHYSPITVWADSSKGLFCCFAVIDIPSVAFVQGDEDLYIRQKLGDIFSNVEIRFIEQKSNDYLPGPAYMSEDGIRTKL